MKTKPQDRVYPCETSEGEAVASHGDAVAMEVFMQDNKHYDVPKDRLLCAKCYGGQYRTYESFAGPKAKANSKRIYEEKVILWRYLDLAEVWNSGALE